MLKIHINASAYISIFIDRTYDITLLYRKTRKNSIWSENFPVSLFSRTFFHVKNAQFIHSLKLCINYVAKKESLYLQRIKW